MSSTPSPAEAGGVVDVDSGAVNHENSVDPGVCVREMGDGSAGGVEGVVNAGGAQVGAVDVCGSSVIGIREAGDDHATEMEIDEAASVSGAVGGGETESLESIQNQGPVLNEAAEISDGSELIKEKLERAVAEAGSTAGAAESTIDAALEGFRAGRGLVSVPNAERPLVESVDASNGGGVSVAVGGFEAGSLESVPKQEREWSEAAEMNDESEFVEDGNVTVAEAGNRVGAVAAAIDADMEGFQAGSLVDVPPVESVEVSHVGEISVAVGGFETESLESFPNQGLVQDEVAEIREESELVKEGDQKREVTVAEAGNTVEGVEAAIDADIEGFQAGSCVRVPSPGLPAESVDVNHGGGISVAVGGSELENLESMLSPRLPVESVYINHGGEIGVAVGGSEPENLEIMQSPRLPVESVDVKHGGGISFAVGWSEPENLESTPSPRLPAESDVKHRGGISVVVGGSEPENLEIVPSPRLRVVSVDAKHGGGIISVAVGVSEPENLEIMPSPRLPVISVDSKHGGDISVAVGGSEPENFEIMPSPILLVESVDVNYGGVISVSIGGSEPENLESTPSPRLPVESVDVNHGGGIGVAVGWSEPENLESMPNPGLPAEPVDVKHGGGISVAVGVSEPENLEIMPSPGLQVESIDVNHGGGISVVVRGSEPEDLETVANQGQVDGEAAEIIDDSVHINDDDQKPDLNVAEAGSMVGFPEATIDPALKRFQAGSLVGVRNPGGPLVESVDISHKTAVIVAVGGFDTESAESMPNQGQVWGKAAEMSEACELIKEGDHMPLGAVEATVDAALEGGAGSLVGLAYPGGVMVESVDIIHGAEVRVEGIPCDDENPNTNSEISYDLLDGCVQTSVGTPEDRGWEAEDAVGDLKSETEVVEMESMGGTAGAPDIVAVGGGEIEDLEVEPNSGVQLEVAEICIETIHVEEGVSCQDKNRSSVDDVTGHDLLVGHLQATEGGLGHGDNGLNQAEVVVDFTVETENMSDCLSLGIDLDPESQAKVEDHVSKDSDLADPLVEVQNQDSHPLKKKKKNPIDVEDLVTSGSGTFTTVTAVEAKCEDGHLVKDNSVRTGEFEMTAVGSSKVVVDVEAQNVFTHPVVDTDSVSGVPVVGGQSRDTYLIDENSNDKGDSVIVGSCLFVETQAADPSPLDGNLTEKGDDVTGDPILGAETSVLVTSHMCEIQTIVSQGNEYVDSLFDDNKEMGAVPVGFLTDGNPDANALEVESSPGRGRTGMESTVHKEAFSPSDGCIRDIVLRKSEPELRVHSLGDSTADFVMDASSVQLWEQELSEGAEGQTQKCVAIAPWTLSIDDNQRARYCLPPQDTKKFSVSDLVWGKVKSHPWWPGQVFDPSDASEMALKHQRKDNFLIGYFGDRTFAWCDESQLKPFQTYFSQMENQSSSDVFVNAVNDTLGEVSRRVELGMTCFCLPEDVCANIKYQKVENAGIRDGSGTFFFDRSLIVKNFQPSKLLQYVEALAQLPTGGADRLELVIAQAQLKAFYRSKGYPELPQFVVGGGLMENVVDILSSRNKESVKQTVEHSTPTFSGLISGKRKSRGRPSSKQKHIMLDGRKQKNLSELMEEKNVSCLANGGKNGSQVKASEIQTLCSSGRKNKVVDSDSADSGKSKKKRLNLLGDLETKSPTPTLNSSFKIEECSDDLRKSKKKRLDQLGNLETKSPSPNLSFKIGECIRRVASQLTGSSPILKCHGERFQKNASKAEHIRANVVGLDEYSYAPAQNRRTKMGISVDYSSPVEMLSQLCLTARDPMKGYSFQNLIISFFTDFRNFCASDSPKESKQNETTGGRRGRKKAVKETVNSQSPSSDISMPDHMKDSYWCDMVYHNSSEKGLMSNGLKRKGETIMRSKRKKRNSEGQPSASLLLGPVLETAQQLQVGALTSNMKHTLAAERSIISVEEKIVDSPTALVLSFNSLDSLPSETNLIRIFSRYGPLKEAETEVLRKTNRVKVVFKRRADAEIAFSSAGKFSIFGPSLVSYQLKYLPSTPNTSPSTLPQGKNDAAPTEVGDLEVLAQGETGLVSETTQVEAVGQG